jgi:hypothetical protein
MKKIILSIVITSAILFSCSKKDSTPSTPSIVGKWNLNKEIYTVSQSGTILITDTILGTQGEYVDFTSSGLAISNDASGTNGDTSNYTFSNNKLTISSSPTDFTVLNVTTLSNNQLNLYADSTEAGVRSQIWIYFSK